MVFNQNPEMINKKLMTRQEGAKSALDNKNNTENI